VLTIAPQRLRAAAEGPRHPGDGQIECNQVIASNRVQNSITRKRDEVILPISWQASAMAGFTSVQRQIGLNESRSTKTK
jgi:hypothetical protein